MLESSAMTVLDNDDGGGVDDGDGFGGTGEERRRRRAEGATERRLCGLVSPGPIHMIPVAHQTESAP
jgi:hypothetical protein